MPHADPLSEIFDEFRTTHLPELAAPGTAGIRAAVHRRRSRATAMAALATVAVVAPAGGYTAMHLDRHAPPPPAASPSPTPEFMPPAERFVSVPAWHDPRKCPGGLRPVLVDPPDSIQGSDSGYSWRAVWSDIDVTGDGRPDALYWEECSGRTRALLLEQDKFGNYVSRAQVTEATEIRQAEITAAGTIRVQLGAGGWKEYRWTGSGFAPVD